MTLSAYQAIAGIMASLLFMIVLVGCSYAAYQGQKARNELFNTAIKRIGEIHE